MPEQPNLSAEVVLPFGDGEHLFALKFKQLEQLEKVCDSGIGEIAHRLLSLKPNLYDIYYTISLGLEGGGMAPTLINDFMKRYFEGRPIANESDPHSPLITATKVIGAVWFGVADVAPLGELAAGESPAKE